MPRIELFRGSQDRATSMDKPVYTVKKLNSELKSLVEQSYRSIWVEGEISGLATPASGHLYFSLKEENSIIRCAFFRNRQLRGGYRPKEGSQVLIQGQISYYEPRGDLQLIVSFLEDAGEGALRKAFERLKSKLQSKGYFETESKQRIPEIVQSVGVITSESGAVIQDILTTLKRRNPNIRVILYPTRVQGESADEEIAKAIQIAEQRHECDVYILARGGGSLEDLQAFNSETVADAIFNCKTPIISAVGHETDFSIADFVADHRAPTPTAAAELVSIDTGYLKNRLKEHLGRLIRLIRSRIQQDQQTVDYLQARLVDPRHVFENQTFRIARLSSALKSNLNRNIQLHQQRLDHCQSGLAIHSPANQLKHLQQTLASNRKLIQKLSEIKLNGLQVSNTQAKEKIQLMAPQNTLNRGYAIVQGPDGQVILDPMLLNKADLLEIAVSKGRLTATVKDIQSK